MDGGVFDFSSPLSLDQFEFTLPRERIAQIPATPRDSARLLVSRREGILDRNVFDLPSLLQPGDLLIFNDTRVLAARLLGHRPTGGRMEVFLLRPVEKEGIWEALVKSNKRVHPGGRVRIGPDFEVEILERCRAGFQVALHHPGHSLESVLDRYGRVPLPPYIEPVPGRGDRERYQTVFARHGGAVAAPTAGLHFTRELLQVLHDRGIACAWTTLHVGLGTFQPLRELTPSGQKLHAEWCRLPTETVTAIRETRARGGRVVAVGTTVARTLESAVRQRGGLDSWEGETELFLQPGDEFRVIDGLITNFHLPRSSLLLLVAAFVGLQRLDRDYDHALTQGYRFYSYGDASLLWP
ncbi:MAG: tRNA preQ1(34) S-adenosylmethionine ribosyltransferase-isomerase QueA [Magnetococcales bacterium]|nr:tRNA preQ1(34) S-adenosylmethionine ribosyltransferase-isomerase QueA [Magnetococcales bacterium]MBF0151702.1 tRNA preQ1(34) S-adenosylmethionine ribosyltransferase-isomerase QueA [Magnetococcales bacterium]MBF0630601.1 tRNA preQ1(34) S-adenosylmethionine ribosyltransferase-isomerase QueA [Magnetococcales bacterium]